MFQSMKQAINLGVSPESVINLKSSSRYSSMTRVGVFLSKICSELDISLSEFFANNIK